MLNLGCHGDRPPIAPYLEFRIGLWRRAVPPCNDGYPVCTVPSERDEAGLVLISADADEFQRWIQLSSQLTESICDPQSYFLSKWGVGAKGPCRGAAGIYNRDCLTIARQACARNPQSSMHPLGG